MQDHRPVSPPDRPVSGARRRSVLHTVRALAGAVLAVGLAGCTGGAGGPSSAGATTSPGGLPAGVTVAVTQQRSDVAERQAEVQIHNGTDAAIRIGAVRLDDPRFAEPAPRVVDRTSTLAAGGTVNVRVQLPEMACDAPAGAESVATLELETGGTARTVTAPAAEVFPFLADLYRRECVAQAVTGVADIALSAFTPSAAGSAATLELSIEPKPGADAGVALTGIRETNLLTFTGVRDGALPLDVPLAGAATAQTIALPVLPSRCDPHAVQEDKRGTVFTIDVAVDGAPGQFTLAADAEMRGRILAWVTAWCGAG